MKVIWEIIQWLFALTYPDYAIIAWAKVGKEAMYTFWVMLIISTVQILVNYVIFGGFFRGIGVIGGWLKLNRLSEKWVEKMYKLRKNKFFYLFMWALNIVPWVPYLSTGTIIAIEMTKIPWYYGLSIVLAGNTVKIVVMTLVFF